MTRRPPRVPVSPSVRPVRPGLLAVLLGLLGLLGVLGATAGLAAPALAHDALTGSTPPDGSSVEVPPASVDLTFSEPPLAIGAEVRVTGPDGVVVNDGDLAIVDTVVSQPLATELPAGVYAVAWRVTSSDGHPISGELSFTAAAGTEPEPEPTPTGTAPSEPALDPPTEPAPAPTDDPTEGTPGAEAADPADPGAVDDGASPLPWILGALVLVAAAGAAWWAARRRSATAPKG